MSKEVTVGQMRDISVGVLPNLIDSDENLVTHKFAITIFSVWVMDNQIQSVMRPQAVHSQN